MDYDKNLRIASLFSRATGVGRNGTYEFIGESEKEEIGCFLQKKGAQKVKRRLLGLCGSRGVKTLDEIAKVLFDLEIVDSMVDARNLAVELPNTEVPYGNQFYNECCYLKFELANDSKGDIKYLVRAIEVDLSKRVEGRLDWSEKFSQVNR